MFSLFKLVMLKRRKIQNVLFLVLVNSNRDSIISSRVFLSQLLLKGIERIARFSAAETVLKTRPVLENKVLKDPEGAGRV